MNRIDEVMIRLQHGIALQIDRARGVHGMQLDLPLEPSPGTGVEDCMRGDDSPYVSESVREENDLPF